MSPFFRQGVLCNSFLPNKTILFPHRNANGETPLMLAMRFVASKEVINLLKKLEQHEVEDEPPVRCPLFKTRSTYSSLQESDSSNWTNELFRDFGMNKMLLVLLLIAALSLYITYCIVGELPFNSPLLNNNGGPEMHRL